MDQHEGQGGDHAAVTVAKGLGVEHQAILIDGNVGVFEWTDAGMTTATYPRGEESELNRLGWVVCYELDRMDGWVTAEVMGLQELVGAMAA